MVIEGGNGLPIREKLLKLVEEPERPKEKKNGKARKVSEIRKEDILEVSAENVKASQAKLKDFDEAVKLLSKTVGMISSGADASDVHSGLASSSLLKIVVS